MLTGINWAIAILCFDITEANSASVIISLTLQQNGEIDQLTPLLMIIQTQCATVDECITSFLATES